MPWPIVGQGMEHDTTGRHRQPPDLEITPTQGPSVAGVRDLLLYLLSSHPLVTGAEAITEHLDDAGLRTEIGGLGFDVWVEPA